ncbi:MAG: DUF3300 domain-containing protein [Phyllobacterium sp.]
MFRLHLAIGLGLLLALSGVAFSTATAQEQAAATPADTAEQAPTPLSEDELEVLVARIALYPDDLVAVVTSASLYPLQIVEAARFLDEVKKDAKLKPKDTWDGSVISLLNYPEIVKMMSDDLDWTQSLGEALAYQQKDVLVAIQQLRDKAVASGIIKTDDKVKVTRENDNIVIQPVSTETIYVPKYEPEMLYVPDYAPVPIAYYPDPYPNYYYPTATYFAGFVTGAVWAAAVDWDDWGVWGGRWHGDVDIDCDHCFNNVDLNGKFNINDVDWKNVDRSKIKFDKNQFTSIDRNAFKNSIKANDRNSLKAKANVIGNDRAGTIRNKAGHVSVKDVRNSEIEKDRINRDKAANAARNRPNSDKISAAGKKPGQTIQKRKPDAGLNKQAGNVRSKVNAQRPVAKPKPAARIDNRPKNPSALGHMDSGRKAQIQSNRGRQAMSGGHRGGGEHRTIHRGGGGRRHR